MNPCGKTIWTTAACCLTAAGATSTALTGCASRYPMQIRTPVRHVVTLDLVSDGDSNEFSQDCAWLLQVPGVVNVLTGPGLKTGQPESAPCDVGVVVDVSNSEACVRLPQHPAYRALMDKWRGRAAAISAVSFGPRCEPESSDTSDREAKVDNPAASNPR